jgi:hypothetical protein
MLRNWLRQYCRHCGGCAAWEILGLGVVARNLQPNPPKPKRLRDPPQTPGPGAPRFWDDARSIRIGWDNLTTAKSDSCLPSVSGMPTNAPNQLFDSGVCDCYLVSQPLNVSSESCDKPVGKRYGMDSWPRMIRIAPPDSG